MKNTRKMIRKKRKLRISMSVEHFDEEKFKGYNLSSCTKKTTSMSTAQVKLKEKGHVYLRVYYNDKFNYNHGVYKTITKFKDALNVFTEKKLLDYIK